MCTLCCITWIIESYCIFTDAVALYYFIIIILLLLLVSIWPHRSAHAGNSSTQCPILPSWPSFRSFTWWVGTGDVVLVVLARWTDQLRNDTGSVPANLWRHAIYGAMVEWCNGLSWLRDDDDNDNFLMPTDWIIHNEDQQSVKNNEVRAAGV